MKKINIKDITIKSDVFCNIVEKNIKNITKK